MTAINRLGDSSSHGGVLITASSNIKADGIGVARLGDLHDCPIPFHGITPLVTASVITIVNGVGIAKIGVVAECGAIIISGSPSVNSG